MKNKTRSWLKVPGTDCAIPLTVIDGSSEGKSVLISAGVHSRECVGIEASRRLAQRLDPEKICGQVVIAHSCNYTGFVSHSDDMNEMYARDISRKVRSSHRLRGNAGEPLPQPPYGYLKNPENHL